jgi:hypothetical protein
MEFAQESDGLGGNALVERPGPGGYEAAGLPSAVETSG